MVTRTMIFKTIIGSKMHGTATDTSDSDYMGICIPDKDFILGTHKFEQLEERTNPSNARNTKVDSDCTTYTLQKFVKLAADNNPNIIEVLFSPQSCFILQTTEGKELLDSKRLFISKRCYYKFMGYATAQFRKLTTKEPVGLRSVLVEKHGYDVKYAYHLIRLYYMGIELLRTGSLVFPTEQRKYFIQIKNGEWPLSAIIDKALHLQKWIEESFKSTTLPDLPDLGAINKLQIRLIEQFWELKNGKEAKKAK